MKRLLLSLCALGLGASAALAQVNVTSGTPASYTTLKGAFDAINAGTHTGAITVTITGDTTETAPAVLNSSGSGAASYSTISIQPTGGAARTISGAIAAGSPMIDFNGADNVTIDGLNTGGNSLTISNTTASATSGTSTIRFIGGATGNTITNATVLGSSSSSVATNGGTIFFSTDAVTANGNDNNTISNCNLGPAGANLPTKAILGNGSTTTTAIGNSGIVITNNNIFDYFGAAVTSAGIATNGGCNTWTITNNRFYQTGTRTWTTGSLHNAINIQGTTATSGAQGFTINGNTVGYASNTQTGTYTLTGAGTGAKFIGILFNGIVTGTTTNVNNNTVAAVSMTGVTSSGATTASPFTALLLQEGNVVSNGNTVGSQSATGSLTFSTTTTTGTEVYGIHNFTSNAWTSNNNNVGGISVTNLGASGTFVLMGMRAFTGSAVAWTANSNTIGGTVANSIQLTATGTASQVLGMFTSLAPANLTSNTVRNLTTNIGTGTTTTASVIGINITTATPNHTLSQNTIFNLTNTNATAASVVTGLQFTGATANAVERNLIYGITAATNSAAAEVNGIRIAGGTTIYRNNMIALGAGVANALGAAATNASTAGINGINEALGTNSFFHNSVYIGGAPTAGAGASYAFNGTQTTNTRSNRDNIFFNARSNNGATGKNYAVKVNGTTANPTGLTLNNNIYLANGSGGVFGFFNSLDVANLAAWRTAVGQDAASFESNPQFLDPTNSTPDLHLNPAVATVAEGNGADVGVANDFDGQTRTNFTPVDIGADAGNFMGLDLAGPSITYTPLADTVSTAPRTLTATITDPSGVPTAGAGLPVLYYRVGTSGAFTASQGASLGGNQYQFTIPGANVNDTVQYYVLAQDNAGNVSASPSAGASGFTANPPAAATPPTAPNSYVVRIAITGSFNVGAGQDYATITAAVADLNNKVLTGPVTFLLKDATYAAETVPITINANPGSSATNTVTFRPDAGVTSTVSAASTTAIFVLNGADWVILDGSNSGGATRDLTVTNTSTSTSSAVIALETTSGGDGATNNVVRNLNIVGNSNTTTLLGIHSGGPTIGTVGAGNHANTYQNNNISKVVYGLYSYGASAANKNTGTVITRNLMNAAPPNNVSLAGMLIGFDDGVQVTENQIDNLSSAASADALGISLGLINITNTVTVANEVTNATVTRNVIGKVVQTATFSAVGIVVGTASSGTTLVANNVISGVLANATSGDFCAGIFVGGGAGSTTRVWFNSVSMTGNRGSDASQYPSFALAIGGSNPVVDVRDNILVNSQVTTGATSPPKSYGIGTSYGPAGAANFSNLVSNYNDIFVSGAQGVFGVVGSLAPTGGTDIASLAAWQNATTGTGKDANSLSADPQFVSATNLHVTATSPVMNAGTPLAGVTTDLDGETRSANRPEIGADELYPLSLALAALSTSVDPLTPPFASGTLSYSVSVPNGTASMTVTPTAQDSNATIQVRVNGGAFATVASGGTSNALALNFGSNTVEIRVTAEDNTSQTYTITVTRQGSPPMFTSASSTIFTIGTNGTFTPMASGTPTPTVTLTAGTLPANVTFSGGVLSGVPAAGTAGSYPLTFTASNGVAPDATQSFTLIINTPPVAGADTLGTRQGESALVPAARLLVNDSDADGDALSLTAVSPASAQGGSVALNGGTVIYTPASGFSGNDAFTYTLSDGRGGLASGTVNVSVAPAGQFSSNITGFTLVNGVPTIQAFGIVGRNYRLEYSDDLGGNWTPLGSTQTTGSNGSLTFTDPTTPLPPQRFYRVVELVPL